MNDPIKIIHKFKNNNRNIQYHIYIYVGFVSKDVLKILNFIKDLSLYDAFMQTNINDINLLNYTYGYAWFKKFYNTYHISNQLKHIKTDDKKKQSVMNKFGKEWYETNIHGNELSDVKIFYSYDSTIDYGDRKTIHGHDTDDIDYRVESSNKDNERLLYSYVKQKGGFNEDEEGEELTSFMDDTIDQDIDQDIDLEDAEVEDIYKEDVDIDENSKQTITLIQKALKDDKIFNKLEKNLVEFDETKDNISTDEKLKNVYSKIYITTQYIYKDDTVKIMKEKITASILNNRKFGYDSYIIPSRQYLWSEYFFNNKLDKIMIGHKWIKRTELLQIDIEPDTNMKLYEELHGNFRLLRDILKRIGNKVKREDDDYNIINDYEGYYLNNDIYMIDIYNDFGLNYSVSDEHLQNVYELYIKLYYPKITQTDFKEIIDYLNNKSKVETTKIEQIFNTINNDLVMENEIMTTINHVNPSSYKNLYDQIYVIQSIIHLYLRLHEQTTTKIDLFRIFNEFELTEDYPFVQYQTPDGTTTFKFNEADIYKYYQNKITQEMYSKWFEYAPNGISFKIRVDDKLIESDSEKSDIRFMTVTLNDVGRMEYKMHWKAESAASIHDISKTYKYVRKLIKKLNNERNRLTIYEPDDNEFRFAFINTIQKFNLGKNSIIDHNDISEFAKYFYPYVTLVVEPRKREGKEHDETKGKFGTYLRYRRVSKYENITRIEQRIIYFYRNYEFTEKQLILEISKQFNITEEDAESYINKVKKKYPNIKKSRKILKKLENIPRYKPPGIDLSIQGKSIDSYKIRISGARNKIQFDNITNFINKFIYLYYETYILKKPDRQMIREKLKKLTNIAYRRNKVEQVVNYEREITEVKKMGLIDKQRLGFKPEKGQNQWTRACQNSGDSTKRQPKQTLSTNLSYLLNHGYKYDKASGTYIKNIIQDNKKVELRAIHLHTFDDYGDKTNTDIYYTCNPKENGEHMYVGFLQKSRNPFGQCMPCCFKKEQLFSDNKKKRDYYLKCIGEEKKSEEITSNEGDKKSLETSYVLQDTNKINEGRFGMLPSILDTYINIGLSSTKEIKHHYLTQSNYYFKLGIRKDGNAFLNVISQVLDISIDNIIKKAIDALHSKHNENIFIALNNGDIKLRFRTIENYIEYITTSPYLDYDYMGDLLTLEGVLTKNGINLIIFEKENIIIKRTLEKNIYRDDFYIACVNCENLYQLEDETRTNIIMYKDEELYYSIVHVKKDNKNDEPIITKTFEYNKNTNNIIYHILDFYHKNCGDPYTIIKRKNVNLEKVDYVQKDTKYTAKYVVNYLSTKQRDYRARYQVVDSKFKVRYVITNNSTIIPIVPSGVVHSIQILKNINSQMLSLKDTINKLTELHKIVGFLDIKPIGIYYTSRKNQNLLINSVMTEAYDTVPVIESDITTSELKKMNLLYEHLPLYSVINKDILENITPKPDERHLQINYDKYYNESYQLFRFELCYFVNKQENASLRNKMLKLSNNNEKLSKTQINHEYKKLLYKIIDNDIYTKYIELYKNQEGGKFIKKISNIPDTSDYKLLNNRYYCHEHHQKESCNTNTHCRWINEECSFAITEDMIIEFVNRVSNDLTENNLNAWEILNIGEYNVSDIIDISSYTQKPNQKIVRSSRANLALVMQNLFGKHNIPQIGKKKIFQDEGDFITKNLEYNMKEMNMYYTQRVYDNNISLYRAYSNSHYWLMHKFYDIDNRNLKFYSTLQTKLASYLKSLVVDWLLDERNSNEINTVLKPYIKLGTKSLKEWILRISKNVVTLDNCIVELYILYKINEIPIYVLNNNNDVIYIFDGEINNIRNKPKKVSYDKNNIYIEFNFYTESDIPNVINVIYPK